MCIKNCQSIRTGSFANRLKKSALGELGRATGGLQAVLKFSDCRFSLIFQGFPGLSLKIAPPFNHKNGGILVSGR